MADLGKAFAGLGNDRQFPVDQREDQPDVVRAANVQQGLHVVGPPYRRHEAALVCRVERGGERGPVGGDHPPLDPKVRQRLPKGFQQAHSPADRRQKDIQRFRHVPPTPSTALCPSRPVPSIAAAGALSTWGRVVPAQSHC